MSATAPQTRFESTTQPGLWFFADKASDACSGCLDGRPASGRLSRHGSVGRLVCERVGRAGNG